MGWEQVGHEPKTTAWIVGNGLLILPQLYFYSVRFNC